MWSEFSCSGLQPVTFEFRLTFPHGLCGGAQGGGEKWGAATETGVFWFMKAVVCEKGVGVS